MQENGIEEGGTMKKYIIIGLALLLVGCATPSRVTETFENGELTGRVTEYYNSTFRSGKAIGIKFGYDPTTYSPQIMILYGRWESARVLNGMKYDSRYELDNVSLLTGEGTAKHYIKVGPYVEPPDK
jgi:hypothetical protein